MNGNEVIAHLRQRNPGQPVHPNDHVNMGQSSNDVIPTAIHVSAALVIHEQLLPALGHLEKALRAKATALSGIVKTGRTHLMDAMPVRMDQEIGGWASQDEHGSARIEASLPRLHALAQGGTAVGTGINAHPEFGQRCRALFEKTGIEFVRQRRLLREPEQPGQCRRNVRAVQGGRGEPDEDRQRSALDEQRAAGRLAEIALPRCSQAAASCPVRSTR